MMNENLNIKKDFIVMSPDKTATVEHVGPSLYENLNHKYGGFSGHELVSFHEFSEDWASWEMHPKGDEIIILISGKVTLILEHDDEESSVKLEEEGSYVIVPKGLWHTAKTTINSKMMFITPGEGTLNREI